MIGKMSFIKYSMMRDINGMIVKVEKEITLSVRLETQNYAGNGTRVKFLMMSMVSTDVTKATKNF